MKKYNYLLLQLIALSILFTSCENESQKQDKEEVNSEESSAGESLNENITEEKTFNNDLNASYQFNPGDTLVWKGKHNDDEDFVHIGTVEVSSGKAEVVNGKLIEGEIIIDLTTLRKGNPRLDNHLKDDDFFNVAIFPNATFRLKNYANGLVNGELNVLGIQKAISFPLTISMNENSLDINGEFELDLLPFELPSLVKVENSPAEEKASGPSSKVNIAVALTARP